MRVSSAIYREKISHQIDSRSPKTMADIDIIVLCDGGHHRLVMERDVNFRVSSSVESPVCPVFCVSMIECLSFNTKKNL